MFDGGAPWYWERGNSPLYWGSWGDLLMVTDKMGRDWRSIGADLFSQLPKYKEMGQDWGSVVDALMFLVVKSEFSL